MSVSLISKLQGGGAWAILVTFLNLLYMSQAIKTNNILRSSTESHQIQPIGQTVVEIARVLHRGKIDAKQGLKVEGDSTIKNFALTSHHQSSEDGSNPRNFRDTQYLGKIEMGGQTFQVLFDTGSALLLLNSEHCKASPCVTKAKYTRALSKTHRDWKREISVLFGNGLISGKVASDSLSLAGLILPDQAFLQLEHPGDNFFTDAHFDGVVGLGLPGLAPSGLPPLSASLITRRDLNATVFNFYFDRIHNLSKSYISFGLPDLRFVSGQLSYIPVIGNTYWKISLTKILIGGRDTGLCVGNCSAILDTGSSLISAPAESAYHLQGRQQLPRVIRSKGRLFKHGTVAFTDFCVWRARV